MIIRGCLAFAPVNKHGHIIVSSLDMLKECRGMSC